MADGKDLERGEPTGDEPKGAEAPKGEAVSRHKREREVGKPQRRVDDLEAENEKLRGEEDGVAALAKRLDGMEAKAADDKATAELEAAGCRNAKAARACLGDCGGDVSKLKEAAPYLFTSSDKTKSTGATPRESRATTRTRSSTARSA